MATSYTFLEEKISSGLTSNTLTFDANSSSLSSTTSFLYTFAIMIIVVAAATQYVLAGGYRIEASERGERKSHELIKRATFGLLGVLSLFVILYTVDRDLLRGDVGLAGLRTEAGQGSAVPRPTSQPVVPTGNGAQILAQLNAGGIYINHNNVPCTEAQLAPATTPPPCTSVKGLPQAAVDMLINLKTNCGASPLVTGGTEPGHHTHGPGLAVVDVSMSDATINSCIASPTKGFTRITPPGFCNQAFTNFSFVFCDEKNSDRHWHIYPTY